MIAIKCKFGQRRVHARVSHYIRNKSDQITFLFLEDIYTIEASYLSAHDFWHSLANLDIFLFWNI